MEYHSDMVITVRKPFCPNYLLLENDKNYVLLCGTYTNLFSTWKEILFSEYMCITVSRCMDSNNKVVIFTLQY